MDKLVQSANEILMKEKYLSPQTFKSKAMNQAQNIKNGNFDEDSITQGKVTKRKSNKFLNKFITNVETSENNSKKSPKTFDINRFEKYAEIYKERAQESLEKMKSSNIGSLNPKNSMRMKSKNQNFKNFKNLKERKNQDNSNSFISNSNKKILKFDSKNKNKAKQSYKNRAPLYSNESTLKKKIPNFLETITFNPTINAKSAILDKKLNENDKMRYTRWEKLYFLSEKQKEIENKNEVEKEEEPLDPECTFAPKLNATYNNVIEKSMNERAEKWVKNKEERLKNLSDEIMNSGKDNCTFSPNLSKSIKDDLTPNKLSVDSINKYIEKKKVINEEKQKIKLMNDNKIGTGKKWKNTKTIPEPFNLSKSKKEKELRKEETSSGLKQMNKSFQESSLSELAEQQEKLNKTQIVITQDPLSVNLTSI